MAEEDQALRHARRLIVIIAVAVLMFVAVQVVLAYAPVDSVTISSYQVDLVTYTLGTNESHWIYAITAKPNAVAVRPCGAISHWVLGFDLTCYDPVVPADQTKVSTVTDLPQCLDGTYNCLPADYYVEHGRDPTTDVDGVKWNIIGDEGLKPGDAPTTHVFKLSLYGPDQDIGDALVAIKYGNTSRTETITGPLCAPSVVDVMSFSAGSGMTTPAMLTLLILVGSTAAGVVVSQSFRKR
jgi:hypothetical protein